MVIGFNRYFLIKAWRPKNTSSWLLRYPRFISVTGIDTLTNYSIKLLDNHEVSLNSLTGDLNSHYFLTSSGLNLQYSDNVLLLDILTNTPIENYTSNNNLLHVNSYYVEFFMDNNYNY